MIDLRNVVVFTIGGVRHALELRWVREIVSLGFVTDVPTAPPAVAGVCNLHGAIVPVVDLGAVMGGAGGLPARQGDGALVVEVDDVICALRVDQVDHVASLAARDGAVIDALGRPMALLDAGQLVKRAIARVTAEAELIG